MNRIVATLLKEFSSEFGLQGLEEFKQFEFFATHLTAGRASAESIALDHVVLGSGGDGGMDAVAIIVNGALVEDVSDVDELLGKNNFVDASFIFVQAETSSSFDGQKISNFGYGVKEFFNSADVRGWSADLRRLAAVKERVYELSGRFRVNPVCKLYYVTTGVWSDDTNLARRMESVKTDLNNLQLFSSVDFEPIGAARLQQLYRETKSSVERTFEFPTKATLPAIDGVSEAYLGFLSAPVFLSLVEDEWGDVLPGIFYDNVRDWQGLNQVNSEIKETLESSAKSRFAVMNNGVTLIAKRLRTTGNRFHIADYQIVNGCQTSNVLHACGGSADETVMVPVRIISTEDEAVIASIVKATNRQTEVKTEQLIALSDFQKQLEQFFKSHPDGQQLYYERRSKQYAAASVEKTRIITPSSLVRSFASMFLEEPHRASRSPHRVFEKVGADIFNTAHKSEPYYVSALAYYRLEYLFRNGAIDRSFRRVRNEVLLAFRVMNLPQVPKLQSNKIVSLCDGLAELLWDSQKADATFAAAAHVVYEAAGGNLDSASLRTSSFTDAVIRRATAQGSQGKGAKRAAATRRQSGSR